MKKTKTSKPDPFELMKQLAPAFQKAGRELAKASKQAEIQYYKDWEKSRIAWNKHMQKMRDEAIAKGICPICFGAGHYQEGGTLSQFIDCECKSK